MKRVSFYIGQTNFPLETSGKKRKILFLGFAASLSLHELFIGSWNPLQLSDSKSSAPAMSLFCIIFMIVYMTSHIYSPFINSSWLIIASFGSTVHWFIHLTEITAAEERNQSTGNHVSGKIQELSKIKFHTQYSSFSVLRHQVFGNTKEWCVFQL